MKPTDVTVKILEEIRDSVRENNERVGQLEETTAGGFRRLAERVDEGEAQTAKALAGMQDTLTDVKTYLRYNLTMHRRVKRCEEDIAKIKKHTGLSDD